MLFQGDQGIFRTVVSDIEHRNHFGLARGKAELYNDKKIVRHTTIICEGEGNKIFFQGKGKVENCHIHIYGSNNIIRIGNGSNVSDATFWIEDDRNEIRIGKYTSLCGKIELVCIEGTQIDIGDRCLFSSDIVFRSGDSHSVLDSSNRRINFSKDIRIGNHVWIGHKVIVNKGTVISDHSVIGTGSVITRQFHEERIMVAGNPGRIIKHDINWAKERK